MNVLLIEGKICKVTKTFGVRPFDKDPFLVAHQETIFQLVSIDEKTMYTQNEPFMPLNDKGVGRMIIIQFDFNQVAYKKICHLF